MESYDDILDPTDGEFVDVIHTNAKHIGVINPAGHVDFYPNGGKRQKDCNVCEYWLDNLQSQWWIYLQNISKMTTGIVNSIL